MDSENCAHRNGGIPAVVKVTTDEDNNVAKGKGTKTGSVSVRQKNVKEKQVKSKWKTYGGIIMALSASFFFSISFLMIKSLENHGIKAFGAALLFNTGVLLPSILGMLFNEYGPGWRNRSRISQGLKPLQLRILFILMIQGILQGSSVVFRTISLKYISVGDMTVIVFSSPIVTTVLAHFIVGEKFGPIFILIAIYTLIGVGLITKPPVLTGAKEFDDNTLIGSAFAGGALLSLSMKFVVTRKIKDTHFLTMTFFLGMFGILISLPLFLIFEEHDSLIPTSTTGLLLRLGLVTGFCAVGSVNLALKMENAGVVALVRSFDVIFAFLLQYIFLGVVPDLLSAVGGFIVWSGVLIVGLLKWREAKTEAEEKMRANGESAGHDHDISPYGPSEETTL